MAGAAVSTLEALHAVSALQEMACSPHRMIGARGKAEGGFDLDNPVVRSSLYGTEPNGVAQLPMSAAASSSVATEQQVSRSDSSLDGSEPTGAERDTPSGSPRMPPASKLLQRPGGATLIIATSDVGVGAIPLGAVAVSVAPAVACVDAGTTPGETSTASRSATGSVATGSVDGALSVDGMSEEGEEEGGGGADGAAGGGALLAVGSRGGRQVRQPRESGTMSDDQLPVRKRGRGSRPPSASSDGDGGEGGGEGDGATIKQDGSDTEAPAAGGGGPGDVATGNDDGGDALDGAKGGGEGDGPPEKRQVWPGDRREATPPTAHAHLICAAHARCRTRALPHTHTPRTHARTHAPHTRPAHTPRTHAPHTRPAHTPRTCSQPTTQNEPSLWRRPPCGSAPIPAHAAHTHRPPAPRKRSLSPCGALPIHLTAAWA